MSKLIERESQMFCIDAEMRLAARIWNRLADAAMMLVTKRTTKRPVTTAHAARLEKFQHADAGRRPQQIRERRAVRSGNNQRTGEQFHLLVVGEFIAVHDLKSTRPE
jgi:hypothetical protein